MSDVQQVMNAMAANFDASKVGDMDASVVFDLSGDDGGQWTAVIANGAAEVSEGVQDDATATIKMDAGDFVDMSKGDLNPMTAFMTGKVKVEGDLGTVMKLQGLFS